MRILFVYSLEAMEAPDQPLSQPEEMNFGLSYISAVLQRAGHQTKLVVLSRMLGKKNQERLDQFVNEFKPALIGFSAVSTEYPFIAQQAAYLKRKYPQLCLMIGGPYASLNPDNILNDAFDVLCIGEGEYPTLELVEQLAGGKQPGGIANLWIKNSVGIEKNSTRPFLENLDELPFPDRRMWQEWISDSPEARYSVLLGRGCPFNCTYCSNHALRRLAGGRYVRWRSPDNIVAEIKEIALNFPAKKEIYLEVETFGVDQIWAKELCYKLKDLNSRLTQSLSFGVNIRVTPGADFTDLFAACRAANFRFINIGLESGSSRVRREVLKRIYDNQDVIRTVAAAKQHGLQVALFNMIGLPTETLTDFKETIAVNRRCQPDWHLTSIFYPYPGTDLYNFCRDQGLLPQQSKKFLAERVQPVLASPAFSRRQIRKNFIWFDWQVYRGCRPWYKLLLKTAANKLRTWPRVHYWFRRLTKSGFLGKIKNKLKT